MMNTAQSLLPFLGVLRLQGEDRAGFLHNQVSNDIQNLNPGEACYATCNTAQGRVIANMLVLNTGEELWVALPADMVDTLIRHLQKYVLRAKVQMSNANVELGVAAVMIVRELDPEPEAWPLKFPATREGSLWRVDIPQSGDFLIGPKPSLPELDRDTLLAWRTAEISNGHPWIDAAVSGEFVAQMLNQHELGAVNFKKGCYPGQEIVARAQYRGHVKRGLALLGSPQEVHGGDKILADNEEMGMVINSVPQTNGCIVLAVIKFEAVGKILYTDKSADLNLKNTFFEEKPSATPTAP